MKITIDIPDPAKVPVTIKNLKKQLKEPMWQVESQALHDSIELWEAVQQLTKPKEAPLEDWML